MRSLFDTANIFSYHRRAMALHGKDSNRALGWRDPQSQIIRFKVIVELADLNDQTLLDAGCGHADLRAYLNKSYPKMRYVGVEQIPELLEVAHTRFEDWQNTSFYQGDFMKDEMPAADYVVACGSLNYRNSDPEFIFKAIKRLFNHAGKGFGFNLLSRITGNGLLVSYNPDDIFAYCKSLCNNSILKTDYSDEDFTVFMYKE